MNNIILPPRRSDGTSQRLRVPQHWPEEKPFRILSIDGGGICGILPASILAELERRFLNGSPIGNYFDLVAGTSTGGIIALGLGKGLSATAIRDLYLETGKLIFPPATRLGRLYRLIVRGVRYAYEREPLQTELDRLFGDTKMGESKVRLVVPSFEGRHGEPWIYKTPHHPDYRVDRTEKLVTVGLSTSAAPTFFEALPNNDYLMVDGGIWANNPIMNAIVDALTCFQISRRQVHILSLGCGETSFKVDESKRRGGILHWSNVFVAAMRAQSLNALGQAYMLIGKDQVMRLDAPESANPIDLDDYRRASAELPNMARSLVESSGHDIARRFLYEPSTPFESSVQS